MWHENKQNDYPAKIHRNEFECRYSTKLDNGGPINIKQQPQCWE